MPTPRFRDLKPGDALQVLSAFLGGDSLAEFTEKIAGQNLVARIDPGGIVTFTTKKAGDRPINVFPSVKKVLEDTHPEVQETVTYTFEVLKREERPDYINYVLTTALTVVDFSGVMSQSTADVLNSAGGDVKFMTRSMIAKPVAGALGPEESDRLTVFLEKLSSGGELTKEEKAEAESVLSAAIDSGPFSSSLGGRMEGLFGTVGSTRFKVPSQKYADVQKMHAGLFGAVQKVGKREFVRRFAAADSGAHDRLVDDTRKYLEKLTTVTIEPGFRTFFSPSEAKQLLSLSNAELAPIVYKRISSRDWVPSGVAIESIDLLKSYIRRSIRVL